MKSFIKLIFVLLVGVGFVSCASHSAESDQAKAVHKLVGQLVSPVPPKYKDGESGISGDDMTGFIHPQVSKAKQSLINMGTGIYPELSKYDSDPRYSYSIVVAAWDNLSVGQVIEQIMADGVEFSAHSYKSRENPNGGNGKPWFGEMLNEIGIERYARHAKKRTKAQLQKEYIKWYITKERRLGFVSPQQEQDCLGPYLKRLSEL